MSFCSFLWSKALQQLSTPTSLTTCELLWFPLKQSAAAAALGAAAAGRAFLSWKGGSRQVSSNQVAKSPPNHQRGVQPCAPPQFWKQVLTQEFFPHLLQLTTQVVLAAVLMFFRIFSHVCSCAGFNTSTSEIWTMRCKYSLSTPFFQHKESIVQTAGTLIVESEHVQLSINSA